MRQYDVTIRHVYTHVHAREEYTIRIYTRTHIHACRVYGMNVPYTHIIRTPEA